MFVNFPLSFTFKIAALAPQFSVRDASDKEIAYVRQKLFKLREDISVFQDSGQRDLITSVKADRIIDFNAAYAFVDAEGTTYGQVKRRGLRSIWRTRYDVSDLTEDIYTVQEGNPWVKVLDSLVSEIPIIGMLTGYLFNPRYDVVSADGEVCYTLYKKPSFTGRRFELEQKRATDDDLLVVMSLIMMLILERRRG